MLEINSDLIENIYVTGPKHLWWINFVETRKKWSWKKFRFIRIKNTFDDAEFPYTCRMTVEQVLKGEHYSFYVEDERKFYRYPSLEIKMVGNKYNYQRYFDTIEGITKYLNEEIYPKIGEKLVVWRDQEPLPNNPLC